MTPSAAPVRGLTIKVAADDSSFTSAAAIVGNSSSNIPNWKTSLITVRYPRKTIFH
jgi:hypothetical protein